MLRTTDSVEFPCSFFIREHRSIFCTEKQNYIVCLLPLLLLSSLICLFNQFEGMPGSFLVSVLLLHFACARQCTTPISENHYYAFTTSKCMNNNANLLRADFISLLPSDQSSSAPYNLSAEPLSIVSPAIDVRVQKSLEHGFRESCNRGWTFNEQMKSCRRRWHSGKARHSKFVGFMDPFLLCQLIVAGFWGTVLFLYVILSRFMEHRLKNRDPLCSRRNAASLINKQCSKDFTETTIIWTVMDLNTCDI